MGHILPALGADGVQPECNKSATYPNARKFGHLGPMHFYLNFHNLQSIKSMIGLDASNDKLAVQADFYVGLSKVTMSCEKPLYIHDVPFCRYVTMPQ